MARTCGVFDGIFMGFLESYMQEPGLRGSAERLLNNHTQADACSMTFGPSCPMMLDGILELRGYVVTFLCNFWLKKYIECCKFPERALI